MGACGSMRKPLHSSLLGFLLLGVPGCGEHVNHAAAPPAPTKRTLHPLMDRRFGGQAVPVPQPLQDGTASIEQALEWATKLLVLMEGKVVAQECELVPGGEPAVFISNPANAGTGGNQYMVFARTSGGLQYAGSLHFGACRAVDPDVAGRARLVTYWHISGSEGRLTLWRLGDEDFQPLQTITIHPGDGGTAEGNAVYDALFGPGPVDESLVQATFAAMLPLSQ